MPISEPTAVFSIRDDRDMEIKQAVLQVYRALEEKGYNPINQLVGYILSEDPTYITTYKNARAIIRRIDRKRSLLFRRDPPCCRAKSVQITKSAGEAGLLRLLFCHTTGRKVNSNGKINCSFY